MRFVFSKKSVVFLSATLLATFFVYPFNPSHYVSAATTTIESSTTSTPPQKSDAELKQEQRAELESQLADYENQIDALGKTIGQYQKQGSSLNGEIKLLNAQIAQINLKVKGVTLTLTKLNQEINETQRSINVSENKIDVNKEALSGAIRSVEETDRKNLVSILFAQANLSDFFGSINDIMLIQDGIRTKLDEITKQKQELLATKEELAQKKEDQENIRALQLAQKKNQEVVQSQKSTLLKVTKGKEAEYQKILKKTQESAAQIRSRIFELLGGGELTFEKAYNYARLAEGASGVRAALILAILSRESLLGKNVGQCSYTTAMHPTRDIPYFLTLLSRLGIDPSSTAAKVSCANSHGAYGGAMGPAQFIPSTWKLYEAKIASVTKTNPPNPWNNSDAFVATGVYIRDLMDSKSCIDYGNQIPNQAQMLRERCAAAKYYAGGNWYTYRFWYGEPVVTKANSFEKDIAVLKG
ncbi:MAG: lytic murein transglycosylase [Candidatus Paceibacterota bacterium]|jgi:peptidoglycan hydrolase CwlO-like protein